MSRIRLSTTVDSELLAAARTLCQFSSDSALIDEALSAVIARHLSFAIDASYEAYETHPITEPDDWGDLSSFLGAAGKS